MERLDLEGNSPEIEVLDGQMSVEELLADLGLEWRPGSGAGSPAPCSGSSFSQPALF
ncbi:hypothetical protein [Pseudarthrobacter sp. NS4]|uniref:hypothetical protein n=1 Tax=Pseudarthrobacter sp. NS4 TaxID=2973976 RepID=UPI0021620684|nr:hypothetical protein [Pseudarthrobacter sp. NS4]